jgi:hypothetical protein
LSERSNCGQPKRDNAAKGGDRGYDAAKRTKGRKRHIVVDVLGLILAVAVTGANVQDRDGGQLVLKGLKDRFPRLARVWADGVYAGRLEEWAEKTAQFVLDIVCKPRGQIGFSVLPWRWIVGTDNLATQQRSRATTRCGCCDAYDRGANLRMAGQLPSPRSGVRDQSTHERGLDQNRHDPPYGAKARLSILRQVLKGNEASLEGKLFHQSSDYLLVKRDRDNSIIAIPRTEVSLITAPLAIRISTHYPYTYQSFAINNSHAVTNIVNAKVDVFVPSRHPLCPIGWMPT